MREREGRSKHDIQLVCASRCGASAKDTLEEGDMCSLVRGDLDEPVPHPALEAGRLERGSVELGQRSGVECTLEVLEGECVV